MTLHWLTNPLTNFLTYGCSHSFVDKLISWHTRCLIQWLTDSLTQWLTHRPTPSFIHTSGITQWLTVWFIHWPIDWLFRSLTNLLSDVYSVTHSTTLSLTGVWLTAWITHFPKLFTPSTTRCFITHSYIHLFTPKVEKPITDWLTHSLPTHSLNISLTASLTHLQTSL